MSIECLFRGGFVRFVKVARLLLLTILLGVSRVQVAYADYPQALTNNPEGLVDTKTIQDLPPPPNVPPMPPSPKEIDTKTRNLLQTRAQTAASMTAASKLEKEIYQLHFQGRLNDAHAFALEQQIIARKEKLPGVDQTEIVNSLMYEAGYIPLNESSRAVAIYRQALVIARKQLPAEKKLLLDLQGRMVRSLMLSHATRKEIEEVCPQCPQCKSQSFVIPIYGFMPMVPSQINGDYEVRACTDQSPQNWYCKKCKGAFYPYKFDKSLTNSQESNK
jgi:hypothetical protein